MNFSKDRILTTHVGSLIRPPALQDFLRSKQAGKPYDRGAYDACLKQSVAEVVRQQIQLHGSDRIRHLRCLRGARQSSSSSLSMNASTAPSFGLARSG